MHLNKSIDETNWATMFDYICTKLSSHCPSGWIVAFLLQLHFATAHDLAEVPARMKLIEEALVDEVKANCPESCRGELERFTNIHMRHYSTAVSGIALLAIVIQSLGAPNPAATNQVGRLEIKMNKGSDNVVDYYHAMDKLNEVTN